MNDLHSVVRADLSLKAHQDAVLRMIDAYASDPFGDGRPLGPSVCENLIAGLRAHPTTVAFLALADHEPVGIAMCFRGFSTFAARPLLYISDFYVDPSFRRHGIGRRLLQAVEDEARSTGGCKLTLEVQENNKHARRIYGAFGFAQAVYVESAGGALALSKSIGANETVS